MAERAAALSEEVPPPSDDVRRLLGTYGEPARHAVDHLQLAVLLESEGVSDEEAAGYGARDVFQLAQWLWKLARTTAPEMPSPRRKDWYVSAPVAVLRGLIFTTAGLMVMTAVGLGVPDGGTTLIIVLNTIGIGLMQAVSFLTYIMRERAGAQADDSVVRPLLVVFVVPVATAAVVAVVIDPVTGAFAGVALTWLFAMVLLLVLEHPVLVGVVVLPVAAIAMLTALESPAATSSQVVVGSWIAGTTILVGLVAVLTRGSGPPATARLGAVDVRVAAWYGTAGLLVGGVVIANLVMIAGAPPLRVGGTRVWLIVALPFLVPVSLAELLVVGMRRRLHAATSELSSVEEFRRLAVVRSAVLWGLHAAVGAAALMAAVRLLREDSLRDRVLLGLSFLLVGTILTAALVLLAGDAVGVLIVLLAATAAALLASRWWADGWTDSDRLVLDVGVLTVGAVVAIGLATWSATRLSSYR